MPGRSINRTACLTAALALLAAGLSSAQASELFSESVEVAPFPPPSLVPVQSQNLINDTFQWKYFHLVLLGNPTLPAQNATDPNTDAYAVNGTSTIAVKTPFVYPATPNISVGPGPVTLPGLTEVTFSGSVNINVDNIPQQNLDNPAGQVQFGLVGPTNNTPLQLIAQHWGLEADMSGPVFRTMPIVNVIPNPAPPASSPTGSFQYVVDFIQFTQDGISESEWAEFPYVPGNLPTFTYSGWADPLDPIHFTNTEIQLSATQIPIDDLNFADDPLTGGSFKQQANAGDIIVAVPEPGSVAIVAAGSLLTMRRRRRRL